MNSFSVDGVIKTIGSTEQKTETFSVRTFVLEVEDGAHTTLAKFQLSQTRCELLDQFSVGDTVTVHFNLSGREWNGQVFTNLSCWKIVSLFQNDTNYEAPKEDAVPIPTGDDLPF